ncbi:MAG TPA: twitch domain-containing radical SAM protein [Chitinophagales bacterium]|nr:twitch domain-containing radical SAM protein [Chitinophagales bacterium]
MILSADLLKQYNQSRDTANKALACHAPFVNLNFEQNGNVRACCYNTTHILGKWPDNSIAEIWNGDSANELRTYIKQNNFGGGCTECGHMIEAGNYQGVRAKYYDEFATGFLSSPIQKIKESITGRQGFPRVMEFELSNHCNLECVMCNGYFSSSIRKNREKLPPIVSPYNEKFVDELEAFIPHLTDAKFLGGEPFMIDIYLSIWERIRKINPKIRLHITTNGTFLNNRIKDLLEGLHAGIILSIDSVNKDTYKKIRVNGNFEKVMENLEYFKDYTRRKKTFLSMAACPITYNWHELPEMLEFCIKENITLYFNAVFSPQSLSLREQSVAYLANVIANLEKYPVPVSQKHTHSPEQLSIRAYKDFINLLKGWLKEKQGREIVEQASTADLADSTIQLNFTGEPLADIRYLISEINASQNTDVRPKLLQLQHHLHSMVLALPDDMLYQGLMCYYEEKNVDDNLKDKLKKVGDLINSHPQKSKVLVQLAQFPPSGLSMFLKEMPFDSLSENLVRHFN